MRSLAVVAITAAIICVCVVSISADGAGEDPYALKPPVLIIPSFCGSRLHVWRTKEAKHCSGNIGIGLNERVWVDSAKVVGIPQCWLNCMMLDRVEQTDLGCKTRAGEGIEAIGELDPGLITGPLTVIWKTFIQEIADVFGYEPGTTLMAAPYDFRVPPSVLDRRDNYYKRLKVQIETANDFYKRTNGISHSQGVIVAAHSMGNLVFRYFIEWLKHDLGTRNHKAWLDEHVMSYVAVGAPHLGSAEPIKAIMKGLTFGLPITVANARLMGSSFGSTPWMMPFKLSGYGEISERFSVWPVEHMLEIDFKGASWIDAADEREKVKFGPVDMNDGVKNPIFPLQELFRQAGKWDNISADTVLVIDRYYKREGEALADYFSPWERPPVKSVYCAYGINLRTEIGYKMSPDPSRPGEWNIDDVIVEENGRIYSQSGDIDIPADGKRKSGDGTVPYVSLAWCHKWLGEDPSEINVTTIPQRFYGSAGSDDYKDEYEKEPTIKFFENVGRDEDNIPVSTAVWEMDYVGHREVVKDQSFLREFKEELMFRLMRNKEIWQETAEENAEFAPKNTRTPMQNEDCQWDYLGALCKFPEFCEYRFKFGDLTLDHSCRIRDDIHLKIANARRQVCECSSPCVVGFCKYKERCLESKQPFGKEGGHWGKCSGSAIDSILGSEANPQKEEL